MTTIEQPTPQLTPEHRIRALLEEVIGGADLFVVDLTIRGRKGSQVVEVYLDADGELDLSALSRVSRELGFLLDTEDVIAGKYTLNVSSPGAARPLVPRQFAKHVGRELTVRLRAEGDAEAGETVEGALLGSDDESFRLDVARGAERQIRFDDVEEARIKLPW